MQYANNRNTMQVTRSLAMSMERAGAMVCIRGREIGSSVSLPCDKKLVVGRDPAESGHTIPDSKVSRKHFEITYAGAMNKYLVTDYSTNGTFLQSGERLKKNRTYYLPPGTELRLGKNGSVYKLR